MAGPRGRDEIAGEGEAAFTAALRGSDADPEYVKALSAPDAMTIPANATEGAEFRPARTGPVFSSDASHLHMRYTARTRSIEWKQDPAVHAAVEALARLLSADSPYIYRLTLAPGMGILCNNVLHDRSGFVDAPATPRLLYRARYHERIAGS